MTQHEVSLLIEYGLSAGTVLGALVVCLIKDRQSARNLKKNGYQS